MLTKNFYIEFGKVIYAMAMADGEVQEAERKKVISSLKKYLVPLEDEKDEFGTDLAFFALFSFESEDQVFQEEIDAAMGAFLDYVRELKKPLSQEIKDACIAVLKDLARTYGRFTKKEHDLLEEFVTKLNKI